ncbi:M15 family metallopeptidase [Nocardioides sp. Bht2]|uniref:M15 family metallopeptidase n=1 Tax=Nocardioides sp. Bht2 TaxID=3392297 RepID=UPI0039B4E437
MTILLSDPRVAALEVRDSASPLVALPHHLSPDHCLVRAEVAARLVEAAAALPDGVRLKVVEGHREPVLQQEIIARYSAEVCGAHPGVGPAELDRLVSRFVAPLAVAPHVSGSAVDLTLSTDHGVELPMGTAIDATPEVSGGRCYTESVEISAEARANRNLLARVLGDVGMVNYPTEWWHWSWGDRYWALMTGAPAAVHGPIAAVPSTPSAA